MDNTNYNIAIIGQTGVGKSSLINYLYGEKTVETGTGRPVTTNGFHKVEHSIQDMAVSIYDSWGLEVGKEEQWLIELDQELKKRGIDKPASEWFHSIFYCIMAPSARIQDADIKIIKKLRSEENKVSVILTKADAISEDDEEAFINAIKKELGSDIAIIPVCSERKKNRSGETQPFGKELVEKQSLIDLVDSLILRVPKHCQDLMLLELESWRKNMHKVIDEKLGFWGYSVEKVQDELSSKSEEIAIEIEKIGNNAEKLALEQYGFILDKLSGRIKSHVNTESLKIDGYNYTDWDWTEILLASLLIWAVPFIMPSLRKGNAIRMHTETDSFFTKLSNEINKKNQNLELSLQGIKQELMSSLVH